MLPTVRLRSCWQVAKLLHCTAVRGCGCCRVSWVRDCSCCRLVRQGKGTRETERLIKLHMDARALGLQNCTAEANSSSPAIHNMGSTVG